MNQAILKFQSFSFRLNHIVFKTYIWLGMFISLISYPALAQNIVTIDRGIAAKPVVLSGNTGGNLQALSISQVENTATGYCDGYISPQPNHLLELESLFNFLRLEIESSTDTTVLIKGSEGVWCNDDSGSANPMIEGQWQKGLYKVWVGSYQPDTRNSYQIRITGQ